MLLLEERKAALKILRKELEEELNTRLPGQRFT